ncbi:MAG: hypothetical protein FWC66_09965, partial [Oscillospiraceae bacterium]|nr:hypothetical protein [Oscillospiraceae bacterium]
SPPKTTPSGFACHPSKEGNKVKCQEFPRQQNHQQHPVSLVYWGLTNDFVVSLGTGLVALHFAKQKTISQPLDGLRSGMLGCY